MKGLEAESIEYVVAVRSNRTVFVRLPDDPRGGEKPEHSVKEVLALLKKEAFERTTVKRADGTEDVRYVVGMEIKVKGLGKGKRRLVIVASDLDRLDPDHVECLLADTRLSNADVAHAYALRNWVEVFYGDGKGELALAGAQVPDALASDVAPTLRVGRYEDGYARHWALVFLAHTLVMYHRMKGSFAGLVEKRGSPVSGRECA